MSSEPRIIRPMIHLLPLFFVAFPILVSCGRCCNTIPISPEHWVCWPQVHQFGKGWHTWWTSPLKLLLKVCVCVCVARRFGVVMFVTNNSDGPQNGMGEDCSPMKNGALNFWHSCPVEFCFIAFSHHSIGSSSYQMDRRERSWESVQKLLNMPFIHWKWGRESQQHWEVFWQTTCGLQITGWEPII